MLDVIEHENACVYGECLSVIGKISVCRTQGKPCIKPQIIVLDMTKNYYNFSIVYKIFGLFSCMYVGTYIKHGKNLLQIQTQVLCAPAAVGTTANNASNAVLMFFASHSFQSLNERRRHMIIAIIASLSKLNWARKCIESCFLCNMWCALVHFSHAQQT